MFGCCAFSLVISLYLLEALSTVIDVASFTAYDEAILDVEIRYVDVTWVLLW